MRHKKCVMGRRRRGEVADRKFSDKMPGRPNWQRAFRRDYARLVSRAVAANIILKNAKPRNSPRLGSGVGVRGEGLVQSTASSHARLRATTHHDTKRL